MYDFAPLFPIWLTCYPPVRTINFGKYHRRFQIQQIKMAEFRLEKDEQKLYISEIFEYLKIKP